MSKIKIKIVLIGHLRHQLNICKIQKFRSSFFKIESIEEINSIPNIPLDDCTYEAKFNKNDVANLLHGDSFDGLVIGIMNYRYCDNFYMHHIEDNKVCISIAVIDTLLLQNNISLENFILKNILEIIVIKKILEKLDDNNAMQLVHNDTRGCLFDMNGNNYDVIYNTEKPIICDACKEFIHRKSTPKFFIRNLEKELKRIRKPFLCSLELFIKKYPLLSVLLTLTLTIVINLVSNIIWELIKEKICL